MLRAAQELWSPPTKQALKRWAVRGGPDGVAQNPTQSTSNNNNLNDSIEPLPSYRVSEPSIATEAPEEEERSTTPRQNLNGSSFASSRSEPGKRLAFSPGEEQIAFDEPSALPSSGSPAAEHASLHTDSLALSPSTQDFPNEASSVAPGTPFSTSSTRADTPSTVRLQSSPVAETPAAFERSSPPQSSERMMSLLRESISDREVLRGKLASLEAEHKASSQALEASNARETELTARLEAQASELEKLRAALETSRADINLERRDAVCAFMEASEAPTSSKKSAGAVDLTVLAKRVLTWGTGEEAASEMVFPLIYGAWIEGMERSGERDAAEALEKDELETLETVAAATFLPGGWPEPRPAPGPNLRRVRSRIQALSAERELRLAAEERRHEDLKQLLEEAASKGASPSKIASARAAYELLITARALTGDGEDAAPDEGEEGADLEAPRLTRLREALSSVLWDWSTPEDDSQGPAILDALTKVSSLMVRHRMNQALTDMDRDELKDALETAQTEMLTTATVPELEWVEPLVALSDAEVALEKALTEWTEATPDECLEQALELAHKAGIPDAELVPMKDLLTDLILPAADDTLSSEASERTLQEATSRVQALYHQSKRKLTQLRMGRALNVAETEPALPLKRTVAREVRALVDKRLIPEPVNLVRVEKAIQELVATDLLTRAVETAERLAAVDSASRGAFLNLSACLDVAEKNGVRREHPVYIRARVSHAASLRRLLRDEGLEQEDHWKGIEEMGLLHVEDLTLLTEGDLRQVGVPRITVRKVLPRLWSVGQDAAHVVAKAHAEFELDVTGGA